MLLIRLAFLATIAAVTGHFRAAPPTISNAAVKAAFSARGLQTLSRTDGSHAVAVAGDDFAIELDGAPTTAATKVFSSATATSAPTVQPGANATSFALLWTFGAGELAVEVRYSLVSATVSASMRSDASR